MNLKGKIRIGTAALAIGLASWLGYKLANQDENLPKRIGDGSEISTEFRESSDLSSPHLQKLETKPIAPRKFEENEGTNETKTSESREEYTLIGKIKNFDGSPLEGAEVYPEKAEFMGDEFKGLEKTVSDKQGMVRMHVPSNMTYQVFARNGDRVKHLQRTYPGKLFEMTFSKGARVSLKLVNENGSPVDAEANISLEHPFEYRGYALKEKEPGVFESNELEPGVYVIKGTKGKVSRSKEIALIDKDISSRIVLPEEILFRGIVLEKETKMPIKGAKVEVNDVENGFYDSAVTDKDGTFNVMLTKTPYGLKISSDEHTPQELDNLIPSNELREFLIEQEELVSGDIRCEKGSLAGAKMLLATSEGYRRRDVLKADSESDENGRYSFRMPKDKTNEKGFIIVAKHPEYGTKVFTNVTLEGRVFETLYQTRGHKVKGKVVGDTSQLEKWVPVTITPTDSWMHESSDVGKLLKRETRVVDNNNFEFDKVGSGTYNIRINTRRGLAGVQDLKVRGDIENLVLDFMPGRDLFVRLLDNAGNPVPDAGVSLVDEEIILNRDYFTISGDNGDSRIKGVVPGKYFVSASDKIKGLSVSQIFRFDGTNNLEVRFDRNKNLSFRALDKETGEYLPFITLSYLIPAGSHMYQLAETKASINERGIIDAQIRDKVYHLTIEARGHKSQQLKLEDGKSFYEISLEGM